MVKIADVDAQRFRLNDADLKAFKKDRRNFRSDYFKPTAHLVSDTALLRDSAYVSELRRVTYKMTNRRRSPWHYVWEVAVAYEAAFVLLFSVAIATGHVGR